MGALSLIILLAYLLAHLFFFLKKATDTSAVIIQYRRLVFNIDEMGFSWLHLTYYTPFKLIRFWQGIINALYPW